MPALPDTNSVESWHRYFAAHSNNTAWDLASQPSRTPEEDEAMLKNAFASAYHWQQVGTPLNRGRADVTLAHVHSLLGLGEQALFYARRSLDCFLKNPAEDWDVAFGHAEIAFAAAAAGQTELHREHYQQAQSLGKRLRMTRTARFFSKSSTGFRSPNLSSYAKPCARV